MSNTLLVGLPPRTYTPTPVCRIHPRIIGPAIDLLWSKLCDARRAPDWPTLYVFLDRNRWAYLLPQGHGAVPGWLTHRPQDLVATYAARQSNGAEAPPITWRRLRDDIQAAMAEKFRPEAMLND